MANQEGRTITGTAAGVPYLALPPAQDIEQAPLIVVWHMMDPPRGAAAMAAALPLTGVPAWRVYLGLPMFGARMPAGGQDEIMRLGYQDALLNLFAPVVEQAAAELPEAVAVLRKELPLDNGPIGLVGGSAGGAAALMALAAGEVPVTAAAMVNPVVVPEAMVASGERLYNMTYRWSEQSRAVNERLDFVRRSAEIAARDPQPAVLLVGGARDDPAYGEGLAALRDALRAHYADADRVGFVSIQNLGHSLAEEPGLEPAPQTPGAAEADAAITNWLRNHLQL